jgi:hypothetical protein
MKRKCLLLTAVATLGLTVASVAQTVPNYVPTNGLVGWWPFNGNANDESGNNNNGSINGGSLINDRNGLLNSALGLPSLGDNSTVSNVAPPFYNFGLSVSVWLKLPNQYNQSSLAVIKNGVPYSNGFDVAIDQNNQAYGLNNYLVLFLVGNGTAVTFISNQSELGQWSHLVSTYDGNSIKIYLNGILKATQPFNLSLNCPNNDLIFGLWDNPTTPSVTNRNIDDIGIWNRALTQQEITDLYNATNCANDLTISPGINSLQIGNTANFTATTSDVNSTLTWQSDFGQGFVTLNNYGNYSGTNSNTLSISTVQLANHNQPIRAISSNTNCNDTSNLATIQIADTCITNVTIYDTLLTTVTDTLIINTTLSLPAPNNQNTILIYPNPASDHITIDNGNYIAMAGYTIKIENNAGQQVFQSVVNQPQFYIDLSTWSGNGLYFVHLIDPQNNTVTVRKIVLQ